MIVDRISSSFLHIAILLALMLLFGCATFGHVVLEDENGSIRVEVNKGPGHGYYESTLPEIPPGHMPPPGKCRIWFPGKPPGQQQPLGDCEDLRHRVPPGAWLIRG